MSELNDAQRHVLEEAERVNQDRMAAVEELAKAVARRVDLEHDLNEAKKEEKRAMVTAEKQGWTRAQVAKFAKPPKSAARKATNIDGEQSRREEQASFAPDAQN